MKLLLTLLFFTVFSAHSQSWLTDIHGNNTPMFLFWHGDSLWCSYHLGVDSNLVNYKWKSVTAGIPNSSLANTDVQNLSGTNTGDNAINSNYANDYRVGNFVSGTNYLPPTGNGSQLTGITESQVNNLTTDLSGKAPLASPAFTGTPTGIGIPVYARVTGSNFTTTGQSLVNITGMSVALVASATYEFEAVISASTSAVTTGLEYGVNFSASGSTIESQAIGSSTTVLEKSERITALNTATSAYMTTSAQTGQILIKGIIVTTTNSGNLTIETLKVTSGTSTVFINSFLKVIRIL